MKVLLTGEFDAGEVERWRRLLGEAMPEALWLTPDEARVDVAAVQAAVVANPAPGSLRGWPNLRLIQSLWAGVDRLLADTSLPDAVPIARMVDPAMSQAMAETALWATLSLQRGFFTYQRRQAERRWVVHEQRRADECPVGVLGFGQMGRAVALALQRQGYPVRAWRARPGVAEVLPIEVTQGRQALGGWLDGCRIVINLLPLTPATRGLLDASFFACLPRRASIVNLARGAHLVDADLLAALDAGQLEHAVLDVFHTEPLPIEHRFWRHPGVTMLPHAAAHTDPRSAAAVVVANLRALRDGAPIQHLIERSRGY